jgi:hypothetical protein
MHVSHDVCGYVHMHDIACVWVCMHVRMYDSVVVSVLIPLSYIDPFSAIRIDVA